MPALLLLLLLLTVDAHASQWSRPEYAGVITDPDLNEISGVAASHAHPGLYWVHNDGGNEAKLTLIRPDGSRVASLKIANATNTDWEDLDSFELDGRHYLLIADTGDNGGIRTSVSLLIVEEPATIQDELSARLAWTLPFRWPDGPRDCEATVVDAVAGEVLLISKKHVPAELFKLALRNDKHEQIAQPIAHLAGIVQPSQHELLLNPTEGKYRAQITGADLSANRRVLAVMNYQSIYFYVRQANEPWKSALKRPPYPLALPWLPQSEAIAFSADSKSLLVVGEQIPVPLIRYRIIR